MSQAHFQPWQNVVKRFLEACIKKNIYFAFVKDFSWIHSVHCVLYSRVYIHLNTVSRKHQPGNHSNIFRLNVPQVTTYDVALLNRYRSFKCVFMIWLYCDEPVQHIWQNVYTNMYFMSWKWLNTPYCLKSSWTLQGQCWHTVNRLGLL